MARSISVSWLSSTRVLIVAVVSWQLSSTNVTLKNQIFGVSLSWPTSGKNVTPTSSVSRGDRIQSNDSPQAQTQRLMPMEKSLPHLPADFLGNLSSPNTTVTSVVPRTIFMFWESGWRTAPDKAQLALHTWRRQNPDFQLVALDGPSAVNLTNPLRFVPSSLWKKTSVQARSDIFRLILLYERGGVWADASLFCNLPLSQWLDLDRMEDLFAFIRRDNPPMQQRKGIFPWVSSWFLVAPPRAYTVTKLLRVLRDKPSIVTSEYFWWHRTLAYLAGRDEYIIRHIYSTFPSGLAPQCQNGKSTYTVTSPMFKRCSTGEMATSYLVAETCCYSNHASSKNSGHQHSNATTTRPLGNSSATPLLDTDQLFNDSTEDTQFLLDQICPQWNCSQYSRNFETLLPPLQTYFQSKGRKLPSLHSPPFTPVK